MHRLVPLVAALVLGLAVAPAFASTELPAPGTPFPSWSLRDHTGKVVTSESLAGKTYLLWYYPKAQTPGCTIEGRGLRDDFPAFQQRGVEILGVSFDDPKANATFVTAEKFPFRLLSDTDRTLALQVGAATSADAPVSRRVSFLVGPDGKVLKTYGMVIPTTHAADVLADIVSRP